MLCRCYAQMRQNGANTMAGQITFKPLIARRQRREDGSYNVKIRVTFRRASRFLSTTITAPSKDVDKDGALKGESLSRGYALIKRFQDYINELDFFLAEKMDVDDVVKFLRRKGSNSGKFKLDFIKFAEKELLPAMTPGTAMTYQTALNSFKRYLNGATLDINDITKTMLMDYAAHVDNEPKIVGSKKGAVVSKTPKIKGYSSKVYLMKLRVVYKKAAERFNDEDSGIINIPRNPFTGLDVIARARIAKIAQGPEAIQALIDYNGPCRRNTRIAIDIYLISFALMGMNTKDMFEARPAKKGVVIYNRAKTKERRWDRAEQRIKIDPRIAPLMEKYKDPSGERLFNFYLNYKSEMALNNSLRFSLHSLAEKMGIKPFSINAARHTWGTIARSKRCGIDKATVDDCLVHMGDHKLVDVYAEKDWQVYWDANKKVLDLFDWSNISGK